MMDLSNLRPAPGSRSARKRVGRGPGSGLGKTSGKGHKGRRARSGGNTPPGYEGGQMPLQRRLPKRGFRNIFARQVDIVNLSSLNRFEPGSTVDPGTLAQLGLVPAVHGKRREGTEAKPLRGAPQVKILAKGTLDRKLVVRAHAFSEAAKAAIEAQGGSVEVLA